MECMENWSVGELECWSNGLEAVGSDRQRLVCVLEISISWNVLGPRF